VRAEWWSIGVLEWWRGLERVVWFGPPHVITTIATLDKEVIVGDLVKRYHLAGEGRK